MGTKRKGCEHEETEKIFKGRVSRKLPSTIQKTARRKLLYLEDADDLPDLRSPPGNRLEALHGDRAGQFSIRINEQWRICFYWEALRLARYFGTSANVWMRLQARYDLEIAEAELAERVQREVKVRPSLTPVSA